MIDKIRTLVRKDYYSEFTYDYHINIVVKYALLLAEKVKADKEIVEIAALLHDIGKKEYGNNDHHLTSATEARKILNKLDFQKDKIESIIHCIESHRGKGVDAETIEAKVIMSADAMSHYDTFPWFFFDVKDNEKDVKERLIWTKSKFERNWNKKIALPEARELVRDKKDAADLLLDAMIKP
jgi:putative nucleotidyltransferase with HDIG domain